MKWWGEEGLGFRGLGFRVEIVEDGLRFRV
jgi:hypothetical protein